MYLNKVFIIGNLTRDPEVKALPSGMQVCTFAIATNRYYRDKEGKKQESTEFHNIVSFGRTAEIAGQYLRKGSSALIEGRIQTRSWDQDGQKRYRTEIVVDSLQLGDRKQGEGYGGPTPPTVASGVAGGGAVAGASSAPQKHDIIDYPVEEINPDDIPF